MNVKSEKLLVIAHKGSKGKSLFEKKRIWLWYLDFGVLCEWEHFCKILKHEKIYLFFLTVGKWGTFSQNYVM